MSENIYLPIHSEEQWRSKSTKARAMLSNYKAKQMLNTRKIAIISFLSEKYD